jgi:hypothetical protein
MQGILNRLLEFMVFAGVVIVILLIIEGKMPTSIRYLMDKVRMC